MFENEEADRLLCLELLQKDLEEFEPLLECACCMGDSNFKHMAQCTEGHLVCVDCLTAYTKEIIFGVGRVAALDCMSSGCSAVYPEGEIKRCLSDDLRSKLELRAARENVTLAKLEDLVTCPYCDFAAILDPESQVFQCYRIECQKRICRQCGKDWDIHEGLPCNMVEKDEETRLRKEFEEKMSRAKIRTCSNCNTEFTKETGCNRMTCRCGATMCYVCREPNVDYLHFCNHTLILGKCCLCTQPCSLWTDPQKDEEQAISEIKVEAQAKRKEMGFNEEKEIGVPAPTNAKKKKKK